MGRSCSFLLLLFLLSPWPRAAVGLLQYRQDCGELGMQLLVFPSHGRTVRFKVLDEFGSRFDVANCSICLHWLNSRGDGSVIFSSGYKGCHVLLQENRYVLRVQLEELLSSGIPVTSYEVNMTCPKSGGSDTLPAGNRELSRGNGVVVSHTGLLHQVSESSLTLAGSHLSSRDRLEQLHTVARNPTSPALPGIWHHSNPARPGLLSQPSGVRPVTQIQGSFTRPGVHTPQPGGQSQPGIPRPALVSQNHPSLVHPGGQSQPGILRPAFVSQNQPGMVHPGSQNQPGQFRQLHPGSVFQNQPGMAHPGGQTQPGQLRPGSVFQNQPGVVHPGGQTQPGIRPGSVFQNQPGMVHPGGQTQPGQFRPGFVSPNHPSSVHPGGQNQPGQLHPVFVSQNHPGGQNQPGQIRPGFVSSNHPSSVHPGGQNQPGQIRPGFVFQNHPGSQNQPGLRPGLVSHSQPGLTLTSAQTPAGFLRPGAQPPNQLGISRPGHQSNSHTGLQGHTGLLHPGHPGPALLQPGLGRPGLQPQPGLLRPGIHSQPSLLQSTALFYPSAGAGTPLTREQCQVPVGRMLCVAPQGRDGCLQAGCCYDDMDRVTPCYYGNTATVQCLLEGHFVLVVPRGMVAPPYNLDSVRLASSQAGCEPTHVSEAFVMFRFPVTHCGTTVQVIEDRLVYENQLISTIDVQGSPRGSITRDSVYILQARCIYNASDLLPLGMEVAVPPTATPLAMPGPLGVQLRIATDESYSSYHPTGDFPLVRVLRDPIYVEVRLLQKTDPNLVLVLHHCWASPGPDATSQPQWPILVDGCPFQGDNYRTRLVPVGPASPELPFPSHYQRFVISTFTFVEPPSMAVLEGEVYISCSASVCHLAQPEPCRPSCQLGVPSRARRSLGHTRTRDSVGTVTSQGCVVFPEVPRRGG
ncbi:ZP1 protein, partial [Ptilonorhynchus violaceus]|nr:ZP1 protein [Ptilonorhynchus violaceus]